MSLKNYKNIIAGVVILVFAVVLFVASFYVDGAKPESVGTDFMPRLVAIGLFLLGIANLVSEINKFRFLKAHDRLEKKSETKKTWKEIFYDNLDWVSGGLMLLYVWSIMSLGFLIPSVIYMFLQILLYTTTKKRNYILYIAVSVLIPVAIYLLFRNYFHLMLPKGILG